MTSKYGIPYYEKKLAKMIAVAQQHLDSGKYQGDWTAEELAHLMYQNAYVKCRNELRLLRQKQEALQNPSALFGKYQGISLKDAVENFKQKYCSAPKHNGCCEPCDNTNGPCCCGAWHDKDEKKEGE